MPYAKTKPNSHTLCYFDTAESEPDRGNGKPPLVMIHGLGSSQNYYMPVIASLPDYRCIALDSYGAARSKSGGEKLTMESMGDDVIGLMDELRIKRAVIVGHSMAGLMVFTIAAAHSDRVAGVVAIGPVSPKHMNPDTFKQRIETVSKDGMEPLANTVPTAATNAKSTPLQKAIIRELIMNQDPKSYASHCQVIIEAKEPPFNTIKVPTFIIAGDEDQSTPTEGCQYIFDQLESPKKELAELKGVGHWYCVEASAEVASQIDTFLTKG